MKLSNPKLFKFMMTVLIALIVIILSFVFLLIVLAFVASPVLGAFVTIFASIILAMITFLVISSWDDIHYELTKE